MTFRDFLEAVKTQAMESPKEAVDETADAEEGDKPEPAKLKLEMAQKMRIPEYCTVLKK